MTQMKEYADAAAIVCRSLKRWQLRAEVEDWQPALDHVTEATLAGTLTIRELDEMREIRDSRWLEHNKPQLRAQAEQAKQAGQGNYLPDLEAAFDKINAGMSVNLALKGIWPDLENNEEFRRPRGASSPAIFPGNLPQESDFVCPREMFRCSRRETREPSGRWPLCALDGDRKLVPVASRPGLR